VSIQVKSTRHEASDMFFREAWAEGTTDDGRPFEFTRTVTGGALVLEVGTRAGGDLVVESILVRDLVEAWLESLEEAGA
jgi:hypothetical protein